MAVSPLNQENDEQDDATGTLASYLKGGPEGAALQLMQQQRGAVGSQQQKLLEMMNQQEGPLSQTGMSDLDKASMMFQAAGALGQTTRSGGFGETLGNLGTAMAGPLSKAAEAQRTRATQLQQLQLARQKLAVEMTGQQGVPASDMLSLIKEQRARTEAQTEEPESKLITLPSGDQVSGTYKGGKYYDLTGKEITEGYAPTKPVDIVGAGLSGEEYLTALKSKDPTLAAKVVQIANGDAMPPTGRAAELPEGKRTLDALLQYEPTGYSNISNATRMKAAKDFTPGGTQGKVMGFAGKALDHLAQMQEYAGKLDNSSIPLFNPLSNEWEKQTGGSNYTSALQQRDYVVKELEKFLKGGTPASADVRHALDAIDLNGSPQQMQKAFDTVKDLIIGQVDPLVDQYKDAMGSRAAHLKDGRDYLKQKIPVASHALDRIEEAPIKGSDRYNELQAQKAAALRAQRQQGQQPAAAPAAGQTPAAQPSETASAAAIRRAMEELARRNAQAGAQ